mgnify:CR=1 FL=1|jgi:pyruvate/2-oxoglutarate dehydrogenase complex dihydrolipoamide acyltransferase (E2) component
MGERREQIRGARKFIGDAMLKSVTNYPQARGFIQVDMGEILDLKEEYLANGTKLAMSALMMKLVGTAMKDFPNLNARIEGEEIIYYDEINCGIGVDIGTGLLVPVIKDVANKSVEEISTEFKAMIKKIKERKITLDDMQGGTFTMTNFANFKPEMFTSIITNDQCIIAGVGGIKKQVVVRGDEDEIVVRPMATIVINMNHTITDGKDVHGLMEKIYEICESPKEFF